MSHSNKIIGLEEIGIDYQKRVKVIVDYLFLDQINISMLK